MRHEEIIPFSSEEELQGDVQLCGVPVLAGHPKIRADGSARMYEFIEADVCATLLDGAGEWLRDVAGESSGSDIEALHRHALRRRTLVVMEDPNLHLLHEHDRIFIKPLPPYLLSYSFWETYMAHPLFFPPDENTQDTVTRIVTAGLGLLRTYNYLIRHKSDFQIAQDHSLGLIPGDVSWDDWCAFSMRFGQIHSNVVSSRYKFGELNLLTIKHKSFPLFGTWSFLPSVKDVVMQSLPNYLFIFAGVSVSLDAMQVIVGARSTTFSGSKLYQYCVYAFLALSSLLLLIAITAGMWGRTQILFPKLRKKRSGARL
ncbi:hypothetical protein ANO11243_018440 [Dothideomycetidae sp. 11243]|nr:hypothetical protein ANO11243_018440 [fungal sp. No.11243]